jgi:hypothetical protein
MYKIFIGPYNHKVEWYDKENPCMYDEVLEGNGCAWALTSNLLDMAHSFVFQNVELVAPWSAL